MSFAPPDPLEFSALFQDLGEHLTADQIKGIFERADKDTSGALDLPEFMSMLCELARQRIKAMKAGQVRRQENQ
jgi:Ca2+-binding EF-hand superfamily protein